VYQEGISLINTVFILLKYGVYAKVASTVGRCTGLYLSNVHIDARTSGCECIHLENWEGIFISGSYLTIETGNAAFLGQQVVSCQIIGCKFNISGTYGVALTNPSPSVNDCSGRAIGCIAVQVLGCTFEGYPSGSTVYLDSLCMSCTVQNNSHVTRDDSCLATYGRVDMTVLTLGSNDTTAGTRGNVVQV
jgi:hypothetical protein